MGSVYNTWNLSLELSAFKLKKKNEIITGEVYVPFRVRGSSGKYGMRLLGVLRPKSVNGTGGRRCWNV
jgi:hypothetical protein